MSQRHQVYVRLPNKTIIGIHHQWLYGQRPLSLLLNFLTFATAPRAKNTINYDGQGILNAAYSFDVTDLYYHNVHTLEPKGEIENPLNGDNNDGITIIDLTGPIATYCFMAINGLEGDNSGKIKNLVPLSAEQYLRAYYPAFETESADEWGNKVKSFHNRSKKLLKGLTKYQVMDLKTVQNMFPAMYKKKAKAI